MGLDVHKDSVFCCILRKDGEKIQHKFGVLTEELELLRDLAQSEGVEEIAMESTSIYWTPIWRVLEPYFILRLVNPYFIKQLPGKKSDVKDAEWIATCLMNGLISGSYVPEKRIQQLRRYDRRIFDLTASISRNPYGTNHNATIYRSTGRRISIAALDIPPTVWSLNLWWSRPVFAKWLTLLAA